MKGETFELQKGVSAKLLKRKDIETSDAIVLTFDMDKYNFEECQTIYSQVQKSFPNNLVLGLFKGIEIDYLKNK